MASLVTRCCRSGASVAEMAKPEPDLPEASLGRVEQRLPAARPHFVRDLVGRALLLMKREKRPKASRGHRRGQCRSPWPMPGRWRRSPEVRIAPEPSPPGAQLVDCQIALFAPSLPTKDVLARFSPRLPHVLLSSGNHAVSDRGHLRPKPEPDTLTPVGSDADGVFR
jgi:hypothetical protein